MKCWRIATVAVAMVIVGAPGANAQQVASTPRYTPATPTVSPYLNLLRNDAGALPNYYALVRPQLNQARFNQQARSQIQSQGIEISETKSAFSQLEAAPTGKASWFFNRGQTNVHGDTGHYYGQWEQRFQQAAQPR